VAGFIVAQVFGLLSLAFVLTWIAKYLGGFGWSDPNLRFNWHPLCMILGMVFLYGNGILIYRVMRKERKTRLKLVHGAVNGTALLVAGFGIYSVLSFHNEMEIPNYYSLHSWIGAMTMTGFSLQLVGGFFTFLFPGAPPGIRQLVLPFHVFGGAAMFAMAVVAVFSGITEKAIFVLNGKNGSPNYRDLPPAAIVLNLLGICVLLFALTVGFLVTQPQFKRRPLPEEQGLHIPMNEETSSVN
jgi:cytochrome b-561